MKRSFVKFETAIKMLNDGWEIFTDRGFGGAPYNPLFFKLYKGDELGGEVHHSTIAKLIKEEIIHDTSSTNKYKLKIGRGGAGRNQGRKQKYGEPTVKVNYRIPKSLKPDIDNYVALKLSEALQKRRKA